MSLPHQDWETVVLRKPGADKKNKEVVRRDTGNKSSNTNRAKNPDDFDPENVAKPVTSDMSLAKAIQTARMAKGLTQKELDTRCSLPKNTVADYENSKAIYVPAQVNKIARELGVKLPRPSKK